MQAWLEGEDGSRIRVPNAGLVVGRDPSCDVVVADATSSRMQAWVRPARGRLELRALGRHPTRLNGKVVQSRGLLTDGDRIELPGSTFVVRMEATAWVRPIWLVQVGRLSVRVTQRPLRVGSGADDDIQFGDLPPGAVELCQSERGITALFATDGLVDRQAVGAGEVIELVPGSEITLGRHRLVMASEGGSADATFGNSLGPPRARKVHFRFLPVGGQLSLRFEHGSYTVELSELRARLVVALLQPRGEYDPGDYVPDEVVIPSVWPGEPTRGRLDMNTLVHRLRRSLLSRGIDPQTVVTRARSGGSTRFCLWPEAEVVVE